MPLLDLYHLISSLEDDDDNPPAEDAEILAYLAKREGTNELGHAAYVYMGDDDMPRRLRDILMRIGFDRDARFVIAIWED
jgi:hypothetical protein